MITQQEVIEKFFQFTRERGYAKKERSNLISPYFNNEFNLSAGHQYVIPILQNEEKEELIKIAINEICIRRIDLEKLGASNHHLLMFEMGVMGVFGYIDHIKEQLLSILRDVIDLIELLGFDMNQIYFSVSEGASVLHKKYPADTLSYECLLHHGIRPLNIVKTKGRQNFIFSTGVGRPAGNSIEIFYKRGEDFTEIASINIYKYLFSEGKLHPMTNMAIGGGFGFDRITYLLNGYNRVFDTPPFSLFSEQIKDLFRNEMEYRLNQDKINRILELIKTLVFIELDGQKPDNSPHGKIMKGFIDKLKSEINYLELQENDVVEMGVSAVKEHYKSRYLM